MAGDSDSREKRRSGASGGGPKSSVLNLDKNVVRLGPQWARGGTSFVSAAGASAERIAKSGKEDAEASSIGTAMVLQPGGSSGSSRSLNKKAPVRRYTAEQLMGLRQQTVLHADLHPDLEIVSEVCLSPALEDSLPKEELKEIWNKYKLINYNYNDSRNKFGTKGDELGSTPRRGRRREDGPAWMQDDNDDRENGGRRHNGNVERARNDRFRDEIDKDEGRPWSSGFEKTNSSRRPQSRGNDDVWERGLKPPTPKKAIGDLWDEVEEGSAEPKSAPMELDMSNMAAAAEKFRLEMNLLKEGGNSRQEWENGSDALAGGLESMSLSKRTENKSEAPLSEADRVEATPQTRTSQGGGRMQDTADLNDFNRSHKSEAVPLVANIPSSNDWGAAAAAAALEAATTESGRAGAESWYYLDPRGNVQGPFSSGEMREWFEAGYFKPDLPVREGVLGQFAPLSMTFDDMGAAFLVPSINRNGRQFGGMSFGPTPADSGLHPGGPVLVTPHGEPMRMTELSQMSLLQHPHLQPPVPQFAPSMQVDHLRVSEPQTSALSRESQRQDMLRALGVISPGGDPRGVTNEQVIDSAKIETPSDLPASTIATRSLQDDMMEERNKQEDLKSMANSAREQQRKLSDTEAKQEIAKADCAKKSGIVVSSEEKNAGGKQVHTTISQKGGGKRESVGEASINKTIKVSKSSPPKAEKTGKRQQKLQMSDSKSESAEPISVPSIRDVQAEEARLAQKKRESTPKAPQSTGTNAQCPAWSKPVEPVSEAKTLAEIREEERQKSILAEKEKRESVAKSRADSPISSGSHAWMPVEDVTDFRKLQQEAARQAELEAREREAAEAERTRLLAETKAGPTGGSGMSAWGVSPAVESSVRSLREVQEEEKRQAALRLEAAPSGELANMGQQLKMMLGVGGGMLRPGQGAGGGGAWGGVHQRPNQSAEVDLRRIQEEQEGSLRRAQQERQKQRKETQRHGAAPVHGAWASKVAGSSQPVVTPSAPQARQASAPGSQAPTEMFWKVDSMKLQGGGKGPSRGSSTGTTFVKPEAPSARTPAPSVPSSAPATGPANTSSAQSGNDENDSVESQMLQWCKGPLKKLTGNEDLTLVEFCLQLEDPSEIREYIAAYLGSTPEVSAFASEFIQRKRSLKSRSASKATPNATGDSQSGQVGRKNRRKKKGQKVDSSLLSYNVVSSRVNQGEIDSAL